MIKNNNYKTTLITNRPSINAKAHTLHRFNLLKSMGLVDNPGALKFKRAFSYHELKTAYALSYRIFLKNNYIRPNFMGMRIREWELNAETATFTAHHRTKTVAVLSLAPEIEGLGLPSETLYPDELSALRHSAHWIAEACNEVIDEAYRNYSIIMEFLRCVLGHSWHAGIDKVIAVTNKAHKTFYEFLYMKQIGCEKSYSDEFYDPVVLMCLDCNLVRDYLSSPASANGSADSYLRDFLYFKNPYRALMPQWDLEARRQFEAESIRDRFQDEIRNSLVNAALDDMHPEGRR